MIPTSQTPGPRRSAVWRSLASLALVLLAGCASSGIPRTADTDREFAGQMALLGNWREAIYRWNRALEQGRDDPRIHNNLAVAYEHLGEFEKAAEQYEKALEAGGRRDRQIEENYRQFLRFYREYREREVLGELEPPRDDAE